MTVPSGRLPDIVIVGGSLAGWMAAAALAKAFGEYASKIRLLDIPRYQPPEAFGSTTPAIRLFHDKLAIQESEILRKTGGTFKLATRFTGWTGSEKSFLHPYGQYGTSIGTVGFHHCWFRLRQEGEAADLADYSLAGVAASLDRFARPLSDQDSVYSSFSYGIHFDPPSYVDCLRSYAIARGVTVECSNIIEVALRGDDGFIDALRFGDGRQLVGDIYLDCTEGSAILAEQALHAGYVDWSRWLPCDHMLSCRSAADANPSPTTQISAGKAGWRWRIPLQDHTSDGMVFCSNFIDVDTARAELLRYVGSSRSSQPVLRSFTNGRRRVFWHKNCIALGGAAGFLEPLEATGFHLAHNGIARLLQLLPGTDFDQADADEYNRLLIGDFEQARDFLILHYHANGRRSLAFWDHCRTADIPDSLAFKIELFRSRGRVVPSGAEAFSLPNWLSIFSGMEVSPRRYHPFANGLRIEELRGRMKLIQTAVYQAAEAMPKHREFLAHILGRAA